MHWSDRSSRVQGFASKPEYERSAPAEAGHDAREIAALQYRLAMVAHDLRAPLAAILTAVDLLTRDDAATAELRRARLERIRSSAFRMDRMINQLLDHACSRLGAGIRLDRRRVALDRVAREVVSELELAFPEREIQAEFQEHVEGEWDPDRIAQVLTNLGMNALQHGNPDTGVRLTLREDEGGDLVVFEVHNHGSPIPRDLVPEISGETHDFGPCGLGLSICLEITSAHGGTLAVCSTASDGTTFTLTLPKSTAALQHPPALTA